MTLLFGYLFDWDGFKDFGNEEPRTQVFRKSLLDQSAFRDMPQRAIAKAPRWSIYRFLCHKPLLGEEVDGLDTKSPFVYPFYVRVNESTGTVIIAASRYTVTEEVVRTFNSYITPGIQRRVVNVKSLAEHLLETGTEKYYAVTYLLADVPGYGSALTSVSLIGDDIGGAAAEFLPDERTKLTPRQLGVRSVSSRVECGRFGSLGSVQFRSELIQDLERFLGHAYALDFYID